MNQLFNNLNITDKFRPEPYILEAEKSIVQVNDLTGIIRKTDLGFYSLSLKKYKRFTCPVYTVILFKDENKIEAKQDKSLVPIESKNIHKKYIKLKVFPDEITYLRDIGKKDHKYRELLEISRNS